MTVRLDHTIVNVRDKHASARFLADILGLDVSVEDPPFVPVKLSNAVTLDYFDAGVVHPQHYAFHVDELAFDGAHARIVTAGVAYWADPQRACPGELNDMNGGRGLYFADPDGHLMELLTVP